MRLFLAAVLAAGLLATPLLAAAQTGVQSDGAGLSHDGHLSNDADMVKAAEAANAPPANPLQDALTADHQNVVQATAQLAYDQAHFIHGASLKRDNKALSLANKQLSADKKTCFAALKAAKKNAAPTGHAPQVASPDGMQPSTQPLPCH
jgi:hypothetical protein